MRYKDHTLHNSVDLKCPGLENLQKQITATSQSWEGGWDWSLEPALSLKCFGRDKNVPELYCANNVCRALGTD